MIILPRQVVENQEKINIHDDNDDKDAEVIFWSLTKNNINHKVKNKYIGIKLS